MIRFHSAGSRPPSGIAPAHASLPVFPADPARDPQGSRDRLAPAHAAGGHDPPGGGRHLRLPAPGLPGAAQGLPHRARGTGPRRRHRNADAHTAAGGTVARKRTLRGLRQGNAAHQGSARARSPLRTHQRGDDRRDLSRLCAIVQGFAAEPLPHPMEIPGRDATAVRHHAVAGVPHEGRLFVRPRPGRRPACLQQDVRRLFADLRAHGAQGDPDGRGDRADRGQSQPRIHDFGRDRRERGLLSSRISRFRSTGRERRFRGPGAPAGDRGSMDVALRSDLGQARSGRVRCDPPVRPGSGARDRGRTHFLFRNEIFRADEGAGDGPGWRRACGPYGILRHRSEPPRRRYYRGLP